MASDFNHTHSVKAVSFARILIEKEKTLKDPIIVQEKLGNKYKEL